MAVLSARKAKEVIAQAYEVLQVPVGAPPEQIVSSFRIQCLRRALQTHDDSNSTGNPDSNSSNLHQENANENFQQLAVAYRFLHSLPLLNQKEHRPDEIFAILRPLAPQTDEDVNERACAMLDVSITSMEQAQQMWQLPYTNYVLNVHYCLRKHVVRRRYSEFLTLHEVLQKQLVVLPVIPERKWLYKFQLTPQYRAQALTQYLMRVIKLLETRGLFSMDLMRFLEIDYRRIRAEEEVLCVDHLSHGGRSNRFYYIICSDWLQSWKKFISSQAQEERETGHPPPGKITNLHLFDQQQRQPKDNLVPALHYRCVNATTWQFLVQIYGGGPPIVRKTPSIYGPQVFSLTDFAILVQKFVRGFLGRVQARKRRAYLTLQDPHTEKRLMIIERSTHLAERMATVRKYVNVKEYQIRVIGALKIQRAFRRHILRVEHALLMAESAVAQPIKTIQQMEEYFSLEEIGLIQEAPFKLAHFLVAMHKGVPIQKLRSRRKSPKWRLFKIDAIGSQLLWSSKKRAHALAFVNVVKLFIEAPLVLKTGLGRRRSITYNHAVVMHYHESVGSPVAGVIELILICESACESEALHFGLQALVTETSTRIADGASYVDGHGIIRKKIPHAKRLLHEAESLLEQQRRQPLRMTIGSYGRN